MNSYTFSVKMSCGGCVGAVIKTLADARITSVDVDFENQKVNVKSDKPYDYVLSVLQSSGKKITV